MSEVKSRLLGTVKVTMHAQDKPRLTTLRLAPAGIKRVEVDKRIEMDGAQALLILDRVIKQRHDTRRQFSDAGRQDLAEVETTEILMLQDLIPKPLDDHEIDALIERSIADGGAQGPQDMSRAMSLLRPQIQGRANMAQVSQRLETRPSS